MRNRGLLLPVEDFTVLKNNFGVFLLYLSISIFGFFMLPLQYLWRQILHFPLHFITLNINSICKTYIYMYIHIFTYVHM